MIRPAAHQVYTLLNDLMKPLIIIAHAKKYFPTENISDFFRLTFGLIQNPHRTFLGELDTRVLDASL
jgi:hypothetical protein